MCKLMCMCMCIYIRWPFIGHQAAKWFACPTVRSLIVQLQVTQADHPNTEL